MIRIYRLVAVNLVLCTWAGSAVVYDRLPERLPTHWNIHGQVDATGPKSTAAFLMPAVMTGLLALLAVLPWLSPKQFQVESFYVTYLYVVVICMALLAYIHAVTLYAGLHGGVDVGRALTCGIALFFALVGNVLGKVRRNFWMGVRTPWTLASERVWDDTHRLAARMFVACGVVAMIACLAGAPMWTVVAVLVPAGLVPVVYSLVHYKRLERLGQI